MLNFELDGVLKRINACISQYGTAILTLDALSTDDFWTKFS